MDRTRYDEIPQEVRDKADKAATQKIAKDDGPGEVENKLRQAYTAMKLAEAYVAAGNQERADAYAAQEQRLHDEIADIEAK